MTTLQDPLSNQPLNQQFAAPSPFAAPAANPFAKPPLLQTGFADLAPGATPSMMPDPNPFALPAMPILPDLTFTPPALGMNPASAPMLPEHLQWDLPCGDSLKSTAAPKSQPQPDSDQLASPASQMADGGKAGAPPQQAMDISDGRGELAPTIEFGGRGEPHQHQCQFCGEEVTTKVEVHSRMCEAMCEGLLFGLCGVGFALCTGAPCICDCCNLATQQAHHSCPACNKVVAIKNF